MNKLLFIIFIFFVFPKLALADMVDLGKNYGFGGISSLAEALGFLLGPAFAIAAVAVIFYFLIGGVKLLTSGGDKNGVSEARNMITHAIIGFVLLMMVFMILQFLLNFFGINLPII